MSQVVSVKVTSCFDQACSEFRSEANISDPGGKDSTNCEEFIVFYDKAAQEIRCEGHLSDSVVSALIKVKDQFGGKLLYEGEEWDDDNEEVIDEARPMEKTWIVLALIFFPITLIYLFVRIVIWLPYKIWKATK